MTQLANAGIPLKNAYWIMSTRTYAFLMTLRTETSEISAFPSIGTNKTWYGLPVIDSASVPVNGGVGLDESIILLVAAPEVLLADDGEVMADVSREASVEMSDAPAGDGTGLVSLWQSNLVGLLAERYIYWTMSRNNGVAIVTAVKY